METFFSISFQEIENVRSSFLRLFLCFKQEKIRQRDAAHKRLLTCE